MLDEKSIGLAVTVPPGIWSQDADHELQKVRRELVNAKQTIYEMREKEQKLKERCV